jgi:hypothetical protein
MEKGGKGKRKENSSSPGLGTRLLAHPGRERARGSAYGPAAAQERGGDGAAREGDGVAAGPLASESVGGGGKRRRGQTAWRTGQAREDGRSPVRLTAACRRWPGSRSKGGWFSMGGGWRF